MVKNAKIQSSDGWNNETYHQQKSSQNSKIHFSDSLQDKEISISQDQQQNNKSNQQINQIQDPIKQLQDSMHNSEIIIQEANQQFKDENFQNSQDENDINTSDLEEWQKKELQDLEQQIRNEVLLKRDCRRLYSKRNVLIAKYKKDIEVEGSQIKIIKMQKKIKSMKKQIESGNHYKGQRDQLRQQNIQLKKNLHDTIDNVKNLKIQKQIIQKQILVLQSKRQNVNQSNLHNLIQEPQIQQNLMNNSQIQDQNQQLNLSNESKKQINGENQQNIQKESVYDLQKIIPQIQTSQAALEKSQVTEQFLTNILKSLQTQEQKIQMLNQKVIEKMDQIELQQKQNLIQTNPKPQQILPIQIKKVAPIKFLENQQSLQAKQSNQDRPILQQLIQQTNQSQVQNSLIVLQQPNIVQTNQGQNQVLQLRDQLFNNFNFSQQYLQNKQ